MPSSIPKETFARALIDGVPVGWKCQGRSLFACIGERLFPTTLASRLLIGLGCTPGGQFWLDLLPQVAKVKTADRASVRT